MPEAGGLGHARGVSLRNAGPAILATLLAAGCVTVQPHERKELAKPEMNPGSDQLEETFHTHIESAREGAFGGHGAQGGGCGCG